jgi:8-oxo-dGTP diphosphatase
VTAAVIIENGRLFVARRGPEESLAGLWELPGGKMEPGETLQGCLRRELLEELEMDSSIGEVVARSVYEYAYGCFELIALLTTRLSDYELHVHDEVMWLERDEMREVEFAPADLELVAQLLASGHLG